MVNNNMMTPFSIPLSRSGGSSGLMDSVWAQHDHHRNRRLSGPIANYTHPSQWRLTGSQGRSLSDPSMSALSLSNCHLVLWSGPIQVGTPAQEFLVHFDTGTSDIWVPSNDCDATCMAFPDWRKYDSSKSSTYELASDNPDVNYFKIHYQDGEWVEGQHAMDVLSLGSSITVPNQVFAQVTSVHDFATCEAEEGVLGLAYSKETSHKFPSLLHNLQEEGHLHHAMYSLYLSPKDDYPAHAQQSLAQAMDDNGNVQLGYQRPTSASSQIIFGGVDQLHYAGCLQWHDLGNFADTQTGQSFEGFWDFQLQAVKFGGTSVTTSNLALIDTGSSYIVGPTDIVAQIATMNHASCFNMLSSGDPQLVDCSQGDFDAAVIDCDQPFFNLEFVADGYTYVMEKEDLVLQVHTSFGEACLLRLVGSEGIPGWVLGDVFLTKYYAAFDFQNQRVGLALATENSHDTCHVDQSLDIANHQGLLKGSTGLGSVHGNHWQNQSQATVVNEEDEVGDFGPTSAPTPTFPTPDTNDKDFDYGDVASEANGPTSTTSKAVAAAESADPVAMLMGFGIGFVAIALLLWRRRRVNRQRRIEAIIRHAEANSPYRDDDEMPPVQNYTDVDREAFVEIDLQTLHRMN